MTRHAKLSTSECNTAKGCGSVCSRVCRAHSCAGAVGVAGAQDGDPGTMATPYISSDFHSIPARLLQKEGPAVVQLHSRDIRNGVREPNAPQHCLRRGLGVRHRNDK